MRDWFFENSKFGFVNFIDGDCVNCNDGTLEGDALLLPITVKAGHGCDVYINSVSAVETDGEGTYTATIPLSGYRNTVVAENRTEKEEARITLFRMPLGDERKFRLSSDDNIIFLQELTENNYSSIFEHPYLAVYKKAHDLYGAKVHLNLFYSFDDAARARFSGEHKYFDLSMMTDRYKEEFKANSDWLKLAFHSASEYPGRPYEFSSGEAIIRDCIAVCREIIRFAGAECISNSTTTHFGSANLECCRALRSLGFRSFTGYFKLTDNGKPLVSYYTNADTDLLLHIGARDFWVDTEEDIVFAKIDSVLNTGTLDEVKESVISAVSDPHRGGFVSVMIHEQYFYPDYRLYLADFEERILWTCKYLHDNGYTGAHITEATTERSLSEYPSFK